MKHLIFEPPSAHKKGAIGHRQQSLPAGTNASTPPARGRTADDISARAHRYINRARPSSEYHARLPRRPFLLASRRHRERGSVTAIQSGQLQSLGRAKTGPHAGSRTTNKLGGSETSRWFFAHKRSNNAIISYKRPNAKTADRATTTKTR